MEDKLADLAKQHQRNKYAQYSGSSLAFIEEVCGKYVPDCLRPIFKSWDENPITVVISATGVGKTWSGAQMALASYMCQYYPKIFITAAPPEDNIKLLLWNEVLRSMNSRPDVFGGEKATQDLTVRPDVDVRNEDSLSRMIKGLIIPTTGDAYQRESKFSGKHAPYLAFICDEGDAIPEEVYRGIDGCLSGGTTRLMIFFNPRKQEGPVWNLIRSGRAKVVKISAFDHPNVVTGENVVNGAVTRQKTIQRMNEWTRPLATGEHIDHDCFQVPDFLIGKSAPREDGNGWYEPLPAGWRHVDDPQFSYKVLAQYPSQTESGLIPRIWFDRAIENGRRYLAEHGTVNSDTMPCLGYDIAESVAGDENVISARYDNILVLGIDRWKGMDVVAGASRAERRYFEYGANLIAVDAGGVGAGTAPMLRQRRVNVSAVKVAERPTKKPGLKHEAKFCRMREQLMWELREWFSHENATIIASVPEDLKAFEEQCLFWEYEIENGEIKITKKNEFRRMHGYSPDLFDSVILTFAEPERKFLYTFDVDVNVVDAMPQLVPAWKYFGSFSYSSRQKSCYLMMGVDFNGSMYVIGEYYDDFFSVDDAAREIKRLEKIIPVPNKITLRFGGHQLWTRETNHGAITDDSLSDLFARHGLYFTKASDSIVNAAIATREAMANKKLKIIRQACPNLIRALLDVDYAPGSHGKFGYENLDMTGEVSPVLALFYLVMHCYQPEKQQVALKGWRKHLAARTTAGIRFHNNE